MNANIITIGDELLIGQVIDTNSAVMAKLLIPLGIEVMEIKTIKDTELAITNAIKQALEQSDIVLLTGGLGPTKDDVTKHTLANYFKTPLKFDERAFENIKMLFESKGYQMQDVHKLQAYVPEACTALINKMGTASGMWFERDGKVLVSMPGVPYEMSYLMENEVIPKLKENYIENIVLHQTISTIGVGESYLAKQIEDIENGLPENVKLAYLPSVGAVRLRLTANGTDEMSLQRELAKHTQAIQERISSYIYSYGDDTMMTIVGKLLVKQEKTLGLTESCTGGFIAHQLTAESGASRYFEGGIVSYSNAIKQAILGVNPTTLREHGAVSEGTVKEMVIGGLKKLKTDYVIAVSGIAGPTGGTKEKPVGTIWIAVGNQDSIRTKRLLLPYNRSRNIKVTTLLALNMLRKFLLEG